MRVSPDSRQRTHKHPGDVQVPATGTFGGPVVDAEYENVALDILRGGYRLGHVVGADQAAPFKSQATVL